MFGIGHVLLLSVPRPIVLALGRTSKTPEAFPWGVHGPNYFSVDGQNPAALGNRWKLGICRGNVSERCELDPHNHPQELVFGLWAVSPPKIAGFVGGQLLVHHPHEAHTAGRLCGCDSPVSRDSPVSKTDRRHKTHEPSR